MNDAGLDDQKKETMLELYENGFTDFEQNLEMCRRYQTIEDMIPFLLPCEND